MSRTDAKPLSYFELEAFLEQETRPAAVVQQAAPIEEQPKLEYCPHCNNHLSALDHKFGQCMACHTNLASAAPADTATAAAPVIVGI